MKSGNGASDSLFIPIRCLCGKTHSFARRQVIGGLSTHRWKCSGCGRRFMIACTPGADAEEGEYWPLYLDAVPSIGETVGVGAETVGGGDRVTPPAIHFACRCGCRLVGHERMYGKTSRCPRCRSQIILRIVYRSDGGKPAPDLEYPDVASEVFSGPPNRAPQDDPSQHSS